MAILWSFLSSSILRVTLFLVLRIEPCSHASMHPFIHASKIVSPIRVTYNRKKTNFFEYLRITTFEALIFWFENSTGTLHLRYFTQKRRGMWGGFVLCGFTHYSYYMNSLLIIFFSFLIAWWQENACFQMLYNRTV